MTIGLGRNLVSLATIRRLGDASRALEQSFERLSSGQRINRASDDPAGLAVSLGLNAKQRILTRAKLNLGDGSSLLTIADSALAEITSVVTRMAELAEQAGNGVYGRSQRLNIDKEFQTLGNEIRRLALSTSFNGISLLTGSRAARAGVSFSLGGDELNPGQLYDASSDGRFVVLDTGTGTDVQVRDLVTGEVRSVLSASEYTISSSQVLANGDVVASGTVVGGSGERQLFYYDHSSGSVRQLTQSLSSNDTLNFSVSDDGSTVAFSSFTRYGDSGTSLGGTANLVVLDVASGEFRSDQAGLDVASYTIRLSPYGSYVALFRAGQPLLTTNVTDADFSLTASSFSSGSGVAVTRGMAGLTDGGKVYFYDNITATGQNPSALTQIFEYSIDDGVLAQRTEFSSSVPIRVGTLSLDGERLFFVSGADIVGSNPLLRGQIFELDTLSGAIRQNTAYTATSISPSAIGVGRILSADGSLYIQSAFGTFSTFDISAAEQSIDFEAGFGSRGNIISKLSAALFAVKGIGALTLVDSDIAKFALDRMRLNLGELSAARGVLGAALSRITSAISLTDTQVGVNAAAESRIKDIDIAEQSAALVSSQILQQISSSLLAQANQQPRIALQLLSA